jgi:EpsI family protein
MNAPRGGQYLIGLALVVAAVAGAMLKPTQHVADLRPKIDLQAMIPPRIADWKMDEQAVRQVVDPHTLEAINRIYSQTLERTYVNQEGERIMLSISYGGDQSDMMQVHKPEVCYPAQGAQISHLATGVLDTGFGLIPVKRLLATQENRAEPIIYWVTVGDSVAVSSLAWKLALLKYGLTGKVPDGLIFRVSSLGDEASAYPLQEEFIRLLLKRMKPEDRKRLIGGVT